MSIRLLLHEWVTVFFCTNVFSYHAFSYHLDTHSYHIAYMFVPHSVKTRVNRPDFVEKLGFQDKIFSKDTILFIPSKVLGDFKANKVK